MFSRASEGKNKSNNGWSLLKKEVERAKIEAQQGEDIWYHQSQKFIVTGEMSNGKSFFKENILLIRNIKYVVVSKYNQLKMYIHTA